MTRYKATVDGQIPFTPEEEAEFDAREAAYVAATPSPTPTKEELLTQLSILSERIQSLA